MVTEVVRSQFYWGKAVTKQERKDVIYWELIQKLPNGFKVNLAEVGPLPDRCREAHEDGLHFQSQFTCRVEKGLKLKNTETVEEAMWQVNKYFGIFTIPDPKKYS
jgi:hypothetical protein